MATENTGNNMSIIEHFISKPISRYTMLKNLEIVKIERLKPELPSLKTEQKKKGHPNFRHNSPVSSAL